MRKDSLLTIVSAVLLAALLVTWLFFRSYCREIWLICQWLMLIPMLFLYDPYDSNQDYGCIVMFSSLSVFFLSFLIVSTLHGALNDSKYMSIQEFMTANDTGIRVFSAIVSLIGLIALIVCTRAVIFK